MKWIISNLLYFGFLAVLLALAAYMVHQHDTCAGHLDPMLRCVAGRK